MDEENDLFYHALNYRGAQSQHAELFWQELQACVSRLIAAEREACAMLASGVGGSDKEAVHIGKAIAAAIRMRSNA